MELGRAVQYEKNRFGMPNFSDNLEKSGSDYRNTNILLVVKWFDKRDVIILSTIHEARMMSTEKIHWKTNEKIQRPVSIVDYNKNMGSVDRSGMQIDYPECVRKTVKWYKKLFFHLLDISVLYSYILHKLKIGQNIQCCDFR